MANVKKNDVKKTNEVVPKKRDLSATANSARLRGARKASGSSSFKAVERTADVFLGRVHKETPIEDIKAYVKNTFNVTCLDIEKLVIKTDAFNAFKITVLLSDRDLLFKPELWPEDVVVGKYYNRLKNRNSSN